MSDRLHTPGEAPYEDATHTNASYPGARDDALPDAAPMDNKPQGAQQIEIRVADQLHEVRFKIKTTTKLDKVMNAFIERLNDINRDSRFLFEGQRVLANDTSESASLPLLILVEAGAELTD